MRRHSLQPSWPCAGNIEQHKCYNIPSTKLTRPLLPAHTHNTQTPWFNIILAIFPMLFVFMLLWGTNTAVRSVQPLDAQASEDDLALIRSKRCLCKSGAQ